MPTAEEFIAIAKATRGGLRQVKQYPGNLGDFQTILTFQRYSYSNLGKPSGSGGVSIVLPLPRSLVDAHGINITPGEIGLTGAAAAQFASDPNNAANIASTVLSASRSAAERLGNFTGDLVQDKADISAVGEMFKQKAGLAGYLARAGMSSLTPDIANGLGAGSGTAVNPFATLVFSGVQLKTHTLEWLLAPESPGDSDKIKSLIEDIRANILPKYEEVVGGTDVNALERGLLTYPSVVEVSFQGISEDYYYKFKPAMVQNFSVDYSPSGVAILKGGKPAEIRISMTLQEATIWTADDVKGGRRAGTDGDIFSSLESALTGDGSNTGQSDGQGTGSNTVGFEPQASVTLPDQSGPSVQPS